VERRQLFQDPHVESHSARSTARMRSNLICFPVGQRCPMCTDRAAAIAAGEGDGRRSSPQSRTKRPLLALPALIGMLRGGVGRVPRTRFFAVEYKVAQGTIGAAQMAR
jgi:hypothetical protein